MKAMRRMNEDKDARQTEAFKNMIEGLAQDAPTLIGTGRVLLGIVGTPGAGKSTITEQLVAALNVRDGAGSWQALGMDGFHLANNVLLELGRRDRKGAPDTFDSHGFAALLQRIRNDRMHTIFAPVFHREIEESISGETVIAPSVGGIVVEGNYLLMHEHGWEAVAPLLTACWFLDVDPAVRRERLVARATTTYGTKEAGEAWVASVDEPNARLIETTRSRASRVIQPL
jgi:pantothenate kinase